MRRELQGIYKRETVFSEPFQAFVPNPLPPVPDLELQGTIGRQLSKADQMLGRLDGLSQILPHPDTLIDFYIRKEAVLSSQIEGTQSTLADLLLFELQPDPGDQDTVEVPTMLRHFAMALTVFTPIFRSVCGSSARCMRFFCAADGVVALHPASSVPRRTGSAGLGLETPTLCLRPFSR